MGNHFQTASLGCQIKQTVGKWYKKRKETKLKVEGYLGFMAYQPL